MRRLTRAHFTRTGIAVGVGITTLFAFGVAVAATAVTGPNGVTADFSPAQPNGNNDFYTSPVTLSYTGTVAEDVCDAPKTYSGPSSLNAQLEGECTSAADASQYSDTFEFKYDDNPPQVQNHPNVNVAAGGANSVDVNYTKPDATDDLGGNLPGSAVDCAPPPGSSFPVGNTTVSCTAEDAAGNTSAPEQFTVTVDGPPTIIVPSQPVSEEATSSAGAVVSFNVEVNDAEDDPDPLPNCEPAGPGQMFPIGTTEVTCHATDSANNPVTSDPFNVTVRDTTAPEFGPTPDVTKEGNVSGGFQGEAYTLPTATDAVDGGVAPDCSPGPGAKFDLGNTEVTCTATDTRNNEATEKFTVTVEDNTPPEFLLAPQDVTVQAQNANTGTPATNGCIQQFLNTPTAHDEVGGDRPVTNDAPDQFDVGDTEVTFTASDGRGNDVEDKAVVSVRLGPQGECTIDPKAPRNVRNATAREDNRLVVLKWQNPGARDFWRVEIERSRTDGQGRTRTFKTKREFLRDDEVQNGVEYRYVIYSVDEAGNRPNGVERRATPHRILLLRPRDGAVISRPPLFDWVKKARARYYNFQLHRMVNGELKKVLSRWPAATAFDLPRTWRFEGRRYRFVPGRYHWFVWPGFGPRSQANYGDLMGSNSFRVKRR